MPNVLNLDKFRSSRITKANPTLSQARARPEAQSTPSSPPTALTNDPRDWSQDLNVSKPLRVIFIGHNPSTQSWETCAPYAHPSNRFWNLLARAEIAPPQSCKPKLHKTFPTRHGIGFIDLFVTSGSDASQVRPNAHRETEWRVDFQTRLAHGTCGNPPTVLACVSKIVAKKLQPGWKGAFGPVGTGREWSLQGFEDSEIWVLPSSSGRAPMTWEARLAPYQRLADRLAREPAWTCEDNSSRRKPDPHEPHEVQKGD